MAYGRLDVFWPDGKFETYPLAQSTVSVGRSVGNTIMLDTDTISRYHFSIIQENGTVYLTDMDSANGTYVDGVKIPSNERYNLRGGEEIQIGHLRMNYHTLQDAPTVPLAAVSEDTQRIEKEAPSFKIDLQLPHIAVTPGSYTSVELLITNKGDDTQVFKVEVAGIPKDWVRINRPMLEIPAEDDALVLINIKPTRRSDTQPGNYQTVVTVRLEDNPDSVIEAPMSVTILPFSGFGMALANRRIGAGERFALHMHNQGSLPLPLRLSCRDISSQLNVRIQPETITLKAGERRQAYFEVQPKHQRIFGKSQDYPVDILVHSTELPHFLASSRGHFIDRPPLPAWGSYILTVMGLFVALLFGLGLLALLQTSTTPPEIESFVVNQGITQIARGTPLQINWTVNNASALSLEVGDETIEIDPDTIEAGTTQISTDELYGEVNIALVAENGSGSNNSASRTVTIYEPVSISNISVSPSPILRNVVQTISISWEAPGAVDIQVQGLEGFVTNPPPVTGNSIQVVGIPEEDFTVTIRASDEIGGITENSLSVMLVTPQCSAIEIDTPIYAQPNTNNLPATTVTTGNPIVVTGIDPSRAWLRFTLDNGGQGWGQRSAFTCNPAFDVESLRTIVVATPTPNIQAPLFTVTPTTPFQAIPTATFVPSTPITTPTLSN